MHIPDVMNFKNYRTVQRRIGKIAFNTEISFKGIIFSFFKTVKVSQKPWFWKELHPNSKSNLIKAESKAVIAGHTGRVHLEKPRGRTKVLLVIPTVCNKQRMKNKDVNICYWSCISAWEKDLKDHLGDSKNSVFEKLRRMCKSFSCPRDKEVKYWLNI